MTLTQAPPSSRAAISPNRRTRSALGRVLVIGNRLPFPLDDGWKRRTFHILRAVGSRRPVTFVTLHSGGEAEVDALREELGLDIEVVTVRPSRASSVIALVMGVLTRRPYHVWKVRSRALGDAIARLAEREPIDVAIATLTHLHPYLRRLARETVRIIDTHNIDSLVMGRYAQHGGGLLRRAYARLTASKLSAHEGEAFASADRVWVCSDPEMAGVSERAPRAQARVIPNGVDATGGFVPREVEVRRNRLLFFGRLNYFPNDDGVRYFVESILPLIRAEVPEAELVVVGPDASAALRGALADVRGCSLMGHVPELPPVIGEAAVVLVPLRMGGGTRLKILEALALGKAVVSTTIGAEGLALSDGEDLRIADSPEDFARAVVELLRDPPAAGALGRKGRQTVRARYDWRQIEQLILEELQLAR